MQLILRRMTIFLVLMVAGLVLYAAWFDMKADRFDETAVPYLRNAIPELASWKYERLEPLLSAKARDDFSNEAVRNAYLGFERLGQFSSMNKPQYLANTSGTIMVHGEVEIVDYQVEAEFASGPATIKLKLVADGDAYYIHHFGIHSEVFADGH